MSAYLGSTPTNVLDVLYRNKKAIALYRGNLLLQNFGSSGFDPLDLFTGGKQGVWYDPSDMTTLFQDVAGTVPVTKDGDPVALMKDKSGSGNHATQTVSASRPIYKTDGVTHWIQSDGIDDYLVLPPVNLEIGSILLSMTDRSITTDLSAWLSAGVAGYVGSVGDDRALALNNAGTHAVVDTPSRISLNTKKTFVIHKDISKLHVKSLNQGLLFNSYNSFNALSSVDGLKGVTHLFTFNSASGIRQPINLYQMIGSVDRLTDEQILNLLRYIEE